MNKIIFGDCRDTMKELIAAGVKVQTCVTSPPYFGLRDYGTAKWEGGDEKCSHSPADTEKRRGVDSSTLAYPGRNNGHAHEGYKSTCGRCGAVRIDKQIGLEESPEQYVQNMVEVFRLVRDLLHDDGVLWLNLGDSYYNYRPGKGQRQSRQSIASQKASEVEICNKSGLKLEGLKEKDLIGIPWRVALALQADGWYLRQDIIWNKPNPMPESVKDRCTKSHEYIFLLSKSANYYYDHEAIQEPVSEVSMARMRRGVSDVNKYINGADGQNAQTIAKPRSKDPDREVAVNRNKRSVWTVSTKQFSGAHFAVYPPELIEPCILAGSRSGDIVFDPFMGSGTTAQVAQKFGRQYLGCELNPEYSQFQDDRTIQSALPL